jgi:hypothetical protein
MENPQFKPQTIDIKNFSVDIACDYGEVGITSINTSLDNKVTDWSFVFILEENATFVERNNLPENVSNWELIGRVHYGYHYGLNPMEQLSRVRKSERTCYTFTLESR